MDQTSKAVTDLGIAAMRQVKHQLLLLFFVNFVFFVVESADGNAAAAPMESTLITINVQPISMLNPNAEVTIAWVESTPAKCYFRFGPSPGNYSLGSVAEQGDSQSATFVPANAGLGQPGIYYAVVTNSPDASISADEHTSAEIQIIVEAQTTAQVLEPRGAISEAAPVFKWRAVDGVPFYHILLSDHPIEIKNNPDGSTIIEGANIIWQAITPSTNIRYGAVDPSGQFNDSTGTPPPLLSDKTYNFVVLNNYGNHPALTSAVQGSVNEFVISRSTALASPKLSVPQEAATIAAETITFDWDTVPNAVSYKLAIFEQIEQNGSLVNLLAWEAITNQTMIDFPAKDYLLHANYFWHVLAWDASGAGSQSEVRTFRYLAETGTLRLYTYSNAIPLPRVEIEVTPIDGSADALALLTDDDATFGRKLVVGNYRLIARKAGYETQEREIILPPDSDPWSSVGDFEVSFDLTKSEATLNGRTLRNGSTPLEAVTITAVHDISGERRTALSDIDGSFTIGLYSGTWQITASKEGFADARTAQAVRAGELITLPSALILASNGGELRGYVRHISGQAIMSAVVECRSGDRVATQTSGADGYFSIALSAGQWTVSVSRPGMVGPEPKTLDFSNGNGYNFNFYLQENAGVVSGFVSDGGAAVPAAAVVAVPFSGAPVRTTTDGRGQYKLNLGKGTYFIEADGPGYRTLQSVQLTVDASETFNDVSLEVTAGEGTISGRVTSDGSTPIADASVSNGIHSTLSDARGEYAISLSAGDHMLFASKSGYASGSAYDLNLRPQQTLREIGFVLAPNAGQLNGRVTLAGAPASHARVTAKGAGEEIITITDDFGMFQLNVAPNEWRLVAEKEGMESTESLVTINAGHTVEEVELALQSRMAMVEGMVHSKGQPLRWAAVAIETEDRAFTTYTGYDGIFRALVPAGAQADLRVVQSGFAPMEKSLQLPGAGQTIYANFDLNKPSASVAGRILSEIGTDVVGAEVSSGSQAVSSNANGEYGLNLNAGSHTIAVSAPGYQNASKSLSLTTGESRAGFDFTLQSQHASVSGVVTSAGQPLPHAIIQLARQGELNALSAGGFSSQSNSAGWYKIEKLAAGNYQLTAKAEGYATRSAAITLSASQALRQDLNLDPLTGRIGGQVNSGGAPLKSEPLAGVTVVAWREGERRQDVTDASGKYLITGLSASSFAVQAALENYSTSERFAQVTPDRVDLDFTMTRNNAKVSGVVKAGRDMISKALVKLSGDAGHSGAARSDPYGNFLIDNLPADNFHVSVTFPGYSLKDSSASVRVKSGDSANLTLELMPDTLQISGNVVDQNQNRVANALVRLTSEERQDQFISQGDGFFRFSGLGAHRRYRLATRSQRPDIMDGTTVVTLGGTHEKNVKLRVVRATAKISGKVGGRQIAVIAERADGQRSMVYSRSNGEYAIESLEAGKYRVRPVHPNFEFTPPEREVEVADASQATSDFSAAATTGKIKGKITSSGSPVKEVLIRASAPDLPPYTTATNDGGEYVLEALPSERTYTVTAAKNGWQSDPVFREISVARNGSETGDFTVLTANASIAGRVFNQSENSGLQEALLSLTFDATGEVKNTLSDPQGNFQFGFLRAGQYQMKASKIGFADASANLSLGSGESRSSDLQLQPQAGKISGTVLHRSRPARNVQFSINQQTQRSNGSGAFELDKVPVGTFRGYLEHAAYGRYEIPELAVTAGRVTNMPINLPAGQVSWRITDGAAALENVAIRVSLPVSQALILPQQNGDPIYAELRPMESTFELKTNAAGSAKTDSVLIVGSYGVQIEKAGYLPPATNQSNFTLQADETRSLTIPLPFRHEPVQSSHSQDSMRFVVQVSDAVPRDSIGPIETQIADVNTGSRVQGRFKREGNVYRFVAAPARASTTLRYNISARYHDGKARDYLLSDQTIAVHSRGILHSISVLPNNGILQKDFTITMAANGQDDAGGSLHAELDQKGEIEFKFLAGRNLTTVDSSTGTPREMILRPHTEGTIKLQITMRLNGVERQALRTYEVKKMVLKTLSIQGPASLSNQSSAQFGYSAISTESQSMLILPIWKLMPTLAGSISATGRFTPSPQYFGDFAISLRDSLTGMQASAAANVYTSIDSTTSTTLHNGAGLGITIPRGAVTRRKDISLLTREVSEAKRYGDEWRVQGEVYELLPIGLALNKPLIVSAKRPAQVSAQVALWDQVKLAWTQLPGAVATDSSVAGQLYLFAQIALLVRNDPLGIHQLSVLPSPFSPHRGSARLGYVVSTQEGQALVTIRIYNMAGDPVRTLIERETQYPGVHVGLALRWDGAADSGELARNGRYVVEVTAEDVSGRVKALKTLVLVK